VFEDAAMAKAINIVLQGTHHRICVWRVNQNACKHLVGVVEDYKKFNIEFQKCIYDQEEEEDFINAWNQLLTTFNLQGNKWLQRLFDKRYLWALVYGRNTFSTDMVSTQINESLNNELKGYISVKHDMFTLFRHFDRLVIDKRYEEVTCDFRATQSTPKPKAALEIFKQAAKVYTPAIFKLFEEEVLQTLNCDLFYCGDDGAEKVYKTRVHGKHHEHTVKFSPLESTVICSCKKFEFAGILCSHALKILDVNNIKFVPKKYILKRWTVDAKVLHISNMCNIHEDPKVKISNRYSTLCGIFNRIAVRASQSDETYFISTKNAENLAEEIEKILKIRSESDLDNSCIPQGTYFLSHNYDSSS
jgi:zinc finger SWIM domain-containing protein 3